MREAAARSQCANNLKQMGLALHTYHDIHRHFPAGTADADGLPAEKRLSWLAAILPFVEQNAVAEQIKWKAAWDAEENSRPVSASILVFLCPAHPELVNGHTHYVGLAGIGADAPFLPKEQSNTGFFGYTRRIALSDIKDGSHCTIAVMETVADNGSWAAGGLFTVRSLASDEMEYIGAGAPFGMKHKSDTFFRSNPIIANTLFVDGTVRSIPATVSPEVLRALVTIAGREEVYPDF